MDILYYLKFYISLGRKKFITRKLESIYKLEDGLDNFKDINLLVFDVDDTIGEHKGTIPERTIKMFKTLQEKGYKIAILTNCGRKRRVELNRVFRPLKIYIEPTNLKPNPIGYFNVCKKMKINPENSAMFGEKLGTDIYGAYLAGYKERILVKPYTEIFGGKRSRWIERLIRARENTF